MTDREVVEKWRQKMLECWAQGLDVFMTALLEDGPQYQESEWKPAKIGKITYDGKDPADDGPEVSILRQPRIKAVSESKQGMFGIFFTSFRGEETRSAGFPGTYYQKSHAESIIAEKSTSTFRYYIKEIL